ncbi:MAG: glycosyltransferase [Alphaproteobacteria bacterium]|nr:glycosyltransferase [Alphaproteobacteria bacterium]
MAKKQKKILIITNGTRGDVEPFIALAQALQASGHHVTICAPVSFKSAILTEDIPYVYMNNGLPKIVQSEGGRQIMESSASILAYIKSGVQASRLLIPSYRRQVNEAWQAAKRVNPDLIIFNHVAIYGHHIAREMHIPAIAAISSPILVPTDDVPHLLFPQLKLGRYYNRWTYWAFLKIVSLSTRRFIAQWQQRNGLSAIPHTINYYVPSVTHQQPLLVFHHYSPALSPRASDWPSNILITGWWFRRQQASNWSPPKALVAFIKKGPPPIYIGFGSMTATHKTMKRVISEIGKMLATTPWRAVIGQGWSRHDWQELLNDPATKDKIFQLDEVPHGWLFPKMAAIVHHGGAGTTAAAIRAGKPSIICPFFADQHYWARRVRDQQVGLGPLPLKKITAKKLTHALTMVISDKNMVRNTATLSKKIEKEDGVKVAVAIINNMMVNGFNAKHYQ